MKTLVEIAKQDVAEKSREVDAKVNDFLKYLYKKYGLNITDGAVTEESCAVYTSVERLRQRIYKLIEEQQPKR